MRPSDTRIKKRKIHASLDRWPLMRARVAQTIFPLWHRKLPPFSPLHLPRACRRYQSVPHILPAHLSYAQVGKLRDAGSSAVANVILFFFFPLLPLSKPLHPPKKKIRAVTYMCTASVIVVLRGA
ncbi:hypothetical protein CDAR_391201 [Caerostris darwini]|uniref:Uncharacterized protein n=1 Tax=Caerostris darwini TaxID=1538125 RepID=A0AAV4SZL5_9ARAC|nr:hypothetical protein CDAR_391201 [Caerostris darwini]